MPSRDRDDPKLSFSELDKRRRERKYSSSPGSDGRGHSASSQAQKSYRKALEQAFDSGRLAEFAATLQRGRESAITGRVSGDKTGKAAAPSSPDATDRPADSTASPAAAQPTQPKPKKNPSAERRKMAKTILKAAAPDDIARAVNRYVDRYQELPLDYEILEKALSHPQGQAVLHALQKLQDCLKHGKPRRVRSLSIQLSIIEDNHDNVEVRDLAARIRSAL
ncbi:MAG: hypothetical protein MJE77_44240 [Proteobacteria bacterium]|nr:hypothetical protein [Pseudomonadota bacterium]